MIDKEKLKNELDQACEAVLSKHMATEGVTAGDATPGQVFELSELFDGITELYCDIIEQNQGGIPDGD